VLGLVSNASAELVGYWRFDGGSGTVAADSSGNNNDGTFQGSPQWVPGRIETALEFDGDDWVDCGDILDITDTLTIACWVNPAGLDGDNGWVARWDNYAFKSSGTSLRFTTPGVRDYTANNTTLVVGEWQHVAVTFVPNQAEGGVICYVNGVEGQRSDSTGYGPGSGPFAIGNNRWSQFYEGMIDDVRVYDHILTEAEIQGAMEGGKGFPSALGPDPADGAMHEATWVTMSWRAGDYAVSHDVYLSDNLDDVDNGTGDAFRGNQSDTMLIAGFAGFAYPDGLVPGTTYYWRIDEVNDTDPNSPWKGDVWSFSIPPKTAYNPDPVNGAEFVDPNAVFTWTPGFGGKLHTVYLGTNFDDVNNAAGGTPLGSASYSPGTLEPEKVYYWRVDEFDPPVTHKGDIWGFTTPGAVGNPQPANGAVDVQMNATLSWTAADSGTSHELYVGTDADAVKDATTASPEYIGTRALGSESYDPGKLAWDAAYYWRVDEVYPAETVKGLVWRFATADFISVDDFESYNDVDPPDPASNRIFDKWIDGFGTTTNGALVGNDLPPYAEQTIVNSGAQSMPYLYDNNLKTSEATLTLVYPRDWTAEGVTKLSLWFRGDSGNAAERMFVALGNAVVYHDDPAATQTTGWNEWVIDLTRFADQGVDLTNLGSITIGFGTKNSPAAGGSGTMYFDDIRLVR